MNKNSKRKSLRKKSPLMKKNSKRKSLRRKSPKKNSKRKSLRKKSSMKRKNEETHIIRPNIFSIENEHVFGFFNLLKEKEEHCGYLVMENYKRNDGFFNLKPADEHNKGEKIINKGESVTCHDIILVDEHRNIYPPCRWHTHPIYANPYPSPTDMFHLIAIKELDTSIIFTTLGIWEIYYYGEYIWDDFTTEQQKEEYSRDIMDRMLVINNNFYHFLYGYFYILPEKYHDTIITNEKIKEYLMYYVTDYIKEIRQFNIQLNFSLWGDNINNDYKFKSPISKNSLIEFNEILKNPNIQRFKHK